MQKDTTKSVHSNGVLPLVQLTYCYGHVWGEYLCLLLLKVYTNNESHRTYFDDEQLMQAFQNDPKFAIVTENKYDVYQC